MKINNKILFVNKIVLCIALLASNLVQAQAPGFDDDVQDVPAAPVDNYVIYLGILAMGLAFYMFLKFRPKNT